MNCFRLKDSNQLETSLQNGKNLLSTYENKLAREEVAPADISSLEKTQRELAVRWLFNSLTHIRIISHSDINKGIMVNGTVKIHCAAHKDAHVHAT